MASERTPVAGLTKTLPGPPPRRTAPPAQTSAAAAQPERTAPSTPAPTSASRPSTGRRGRRVDNRTTDVIADEAQVPVNLSLPTKLCTLTRERSKADDHTIATTLMDAIVATHDRLPELVQRLKRKESKDILFVRIEPATKEERSQLPFRMLGVNLKTIDRLVAKFDADDRSQLCCAALSDYLAYEADEDTD
ncbi:hypothetical protein [Gordonia otitidis]|uniref:Uncharacterized protein n=1 Tax=Gordonia otitidis (strain DSM 44809 / CCUG 52243 / JCM 12355 / NBRC 100426 / IFM 10032) TaxID=1108044 RepID=H5TS75_GORO1|nr:hypothetical protein [Gordonia otitidis]GAB36333.1 hypothetical protein GOOTI_207_00180 [Gordonia otitidis NBRC 100426]